MLTRTSTHATAGARDLGAYRRAVEDAARRYGATSGRVSVPALLRGARMAAVLDAVPGGRRAVAHRIEQELRAFRPSDRSNAPTASALLRIMLL
ncbi:MAG: hypothetical protein L0H84_16730, partial [Pseudonocardia sp.]|nr:hypothetical protein [Pseudonocardia sp.]